jgi:meso-butanediol dehydrogenase/(S,S)-butanediol dehydrogenase/diacetyl reductase
MGKLDGKIIVVTGAGRGLGQAVMGRLVKEGAQVAAIGRDAARLADATGPLGGGAVPFAGDLGVTADVDAVFAAIEDRFGRIDGLVNNAAVYDVFEIEEADPERIRASIDTNLIAPMLCTRKAIPLLRKSGGGEIINISSEAALHPYNLLSAYAATKAGLDGFSRAMKGELKADNIRVSTLRLGTMRGTGTSMSPETAKRFMERNAASLLTATTGGMMELESVAGMVLTLLTLPVDLSCEQVDLVPSGMQGR